MKSLGNEIFVQKGETWSLDFEIITDKGDPFMLFKGWRNPYLVMTITAARYEQKGNFRQSWWLDIDKAFVEKADGSMELAPMKRFVYPKPLYTDNFNIETILTIYDNFTADGDKTNPSDITNYLFYQDNLGEKLYKYVKDYTFDAENNIIAEWEEYNFRIIKQFSTENWIEQNYLFDIRILAGESLEEHVYNYLLSNNITVNMAETQEELQTQINQITDTNKKKEMQKLFDEGWPLFPKFDTNLILLNPTKLNVSANIMGGIK
jgi:hypothetical protein